MPPHKRNPLLIVSPNWSPYVLTTKPSIDIITLDRRYNGYSNFRYRASISADRDYCEVREWCWEVFGPGCELEAIMARPGNVWCFDYVDSPRRRYVYLKGDEQLALFRLKWT